MKYFAKTTKTIWKIRIEIYVNMAPNSVLFKITSIGTFLVVQWLRLHAPNAGGLHLILGQGTRACRPQLRDHMLQLRSGETKYIFFRKITSIVATEIQKSSNQSVF